MTKTLLRKIVGTGYDLYRHVIPVHNPYVAPENNRLRAYRCFSGNIETIEPVTAGDLIPLSPTLLQKPGFVQIDNHIYDLRQDGLYRFFRLPHISEQRLVCTNGLESALQAMGYSWAYGNADDRLADDRIYAEIKTRTLACGCHNLSVLACRVLGEMNIQTRLVACMSQRPWGGQDDGHTLVEIHDGTQWIAYDPSFGKLFKKEGHLFSLFELSQTNLTDVTLVDLPGQPGQRGFTAKEYNYSFWVEERFLSAIALKDWYGRVMDVALVHDGHAFSYNAATVGSEAKEKFEHTYNPLDNEVFMKRFYP